MSDESALLRLYESCARRDLDSDDARAWLYGVATNLLRGHVRTEQTRVANVVDARALAARLGPLVAELRPAERDVLLLTAWGGLSLTEIATATSVPVATVRTRLHRARARLRRQLAVRADAHRLLRAVSGPDKQEDRHA